MKFTSSQLAYLLGNREARGNLRALLKYVLTLLAVITLYAVVFHVIKGQVEGEEHSWITGFYWTLVVMTTLGFGDITFTSDIGRLFSILVLLSGVVLLLVMLPFMFISLFYAPWLEARVRLRAPREVPADTRGHVILTEYDAIAVGLIERLRTERIPYYVIEPDPTVAARMIGEGITVIAGDNDSSATYERTNAKAARMLLANCEDTTNTNITITAREIAPELPIAAIVEEEDSIDVLRLSGATTVLPLKHQLGEYLANRADTGGDAHVIGAYRGLQIAELPARDTDSRRPDGQRHPPAGEDRSQRGRSLGARKAAARVSRFHDRAQRRHRRRGDGVADRDAQRLDAGQTAASAAGADHRRRQGRSGGGTGLETEGHRGSCHRSQRARARADA